MLTSKKLRISEAMSAPNIPGQINAVSACSKTFFTRKSLKNYSLSTSLSIFLLLQPNLSYSESWGGENLDNLGYSVNTAVTLIDELDKSLTTTIDVALGLERRMLVLGNVNTSQYLEAINVYNRTEGIRSVANTIKNNPLVKGLGVIGNVTDGIQVGIEAYSWVTDENLDLLSNLQHGVDVARAGLRANPVGAFADTVLISNVEQIFEAQRDILQYDIRGHEATMELFDLLQSGDSRAYYASLVDYSNLKTEDEAITAARNAQGSYERRLSLAISDAESHLSEVSEKIRDLPLICIGACADKRRLYEAWEREISQQISAFQSIFNNSNIGVEFEVLALSAVQDNLISSIENNLNDIGNSADVLADQVEDYRENLVDSPIEEGTSETINPDSDTEDNTSDNELVVTENDEGEPVLGNNAGTNIEIQPTGPTPEEIAEEEERLAELRRQEIARLELERTAQFEVKLAREVQIQNLDNELALLEFGDQQEALNALSLVTGEEQRLRAELNDTGLNAADQQLLQDLLVYQETLEDELDRITGRISSLESERDTLQSELDSANTVIIANSDQLNALNYDYNLFTEPTTSEELIDWSDYDYEIPAFDPTELLTSDLSNVVGYAVSVPVVGGNNRVDIDLVAEDNTILDLGIPGAITELEDGSSDLLDGFTHIYFGSGVDENGDDSQWVYGEAATPEQYALRTGTATFNGGLSGYYTHGTVSDHTLYQEGVSGELALEVDFGTNRLTGEGQIEIDTAVRNETLAFSLNESTITETDSGLTRSLGFNANTTLENESTFSGNLGGTFYGDDASEAAGSFAFDLGAGFSAGLWAASENYVPNEGGDYPVIVSYSNLNGGITDRGDAGIDKIPELGDTLQLTIDGTATTVTSVSNVQAGDYDYTSMGQWTGGAPSSPINTGYWVAGEATPTSGLDVRTGSATFAGNIIGDFVSYFERGNETREDATGTIRLTADFSQDQIDGEMQFVSADTATEIIALTSPISNSGYFFESNDIDFDRPVYAYGFSGTFFGSSADELGGSVWAVTELGSYNGVFRAGENLSFGGFVTPTATQPMDYSTYRGLAAYVAIDSYDASTSDFVTLNTINSNSVAYFENTSVTNDVVASTDNLGQDYSYTNWGSWQNGSAALVDGVAGRDVNANWIVYDPTTDLRTTGQATYNGDAVGLTSNRDPTGDTQLTLTGDIQLTADFANDRITGTMDLFSAPENLWADVFFDTSITRDTNASGFQGALTGSDVNSGIIFGGFAGPNAEEIGGGWQIDNANGSDANGIFRAQN